jgi:hypothetical protein
LNQDPSISSTIRATKHRFGSVVHHGRASQPRSNRRRPPPQGHLPGSLRGLLPLPITDTPEDAARHRPRLPPGLTQWSPRCFRRTRRMPGMRQARLALLRAQAGREKRDTDEAASDAATETEQRVLGLMADALSAPRPRPRPNRRHSQTRSPRPSSTRSITPSAPS